MIQSIFHKHDFKLLEKYVEAGSIIPVVGAGMSAPFGYPLWGQFLRECCGDNSSVKAAISLISDGNYVEAAEILCNQQQAAFFAKIRDVFASETPQLKAANPNIASISQAIFWLPRITRGPVLTTNLDPVIEFIYKKAGREFSAIYDGGQLGNLSESLQIGEHVLLKIHGDAANNHTRVFTKTEYNRHYNNSDELIDFNKPLPQSLRYAFSKRALLFLGCSLAKDRYLDVLEKVTEIFSEDHHFAIIAKPTDPIAEEKLINRLHAYRIRPIWFTSGRYDEIQEILKHLAAPGLPVKLPPLRVKPTEYTIELDATSGSEFDLLAQAVHLLAEQTTVISPMRYLLANEFSELTPGITDRGLPRQFHLSWNTQGQIATLNVAPALATNTNRDLKTLTLPFGRSSETKKINFSYYPNGTSSLSVYELEIIAAAEVISIKLTKGKSSLTILLLARGRRKVALK